VTVPDPDVAIRAPGPWTHRDVSAHGARFHVVEAGEGPAVVLLHGFPMFWWTWRHHLTHLAEAGFRAIAMDLRGYGGSDHPPHGYDPRTLAADVAGVIRCLGEEDAVLVGHGWGGVIAWSTAVLEPETVRAIVPVSMPHPRVLRRAVWRSTRQRRALRYMAGLQLPFTPERSLTANDGERVADLLRGWSVDEGWLDEPTTDAFRGAFLRWPTPHTAVEYHRWAARSSLRPDGLSYMALMEAPVARPVLQIHGEQDPMILIDSVAGSEQYVRGPYQRVDLPTGHFPHEEAPGAFADALLEWLRE
jgi:pimeloyl-ACP methyl ester carboxylesterase